MSDAGTFDLLNDALSTQLERLMSADDEQVEKEIKRSNAVAKLANNINKNMANAVEVAKIVAQDGADMSCMRGNIPQMLMPPKDKAS